MRLLQLVLTAGMTGCAGGTNVHVVESWQTPASPLVTPSSVYPTNVEYEILGTVQGRACLANDTLAANPVTVATVDPLEPGAGHPMVYQAAKYAALESMPEADNLIAIRAQVDQDEAQQCTTIEGRAYRITALSATLPSGGAGPHRDGAQLFGAAPDSASSFGATGTSARRNQASRGHSDSQASQVAVLLGPTILDDGLLVGANWRYRKQVVGFELAAFTNLGDGTLTPTVGLVVGLPPTNRVSPYLAARAGYAVGWASPVLGAATGTDISLVSGLGIRLELAGSGFLDTDIGLALVGGPTFAW